MGKYSPPFIINNEILQYVSSIMEKIGNVSSFNALISRNAFSGCSSLQSFTIPTKVSEIGKSAFSQCALTKIYVSIIDFPAF